MMWSMPKVSSAARNGGSLKMPLVVSQTWSRMVRLMGRFRCSMSSAETSSMRASITGSISPMWPMTSRNPRPASPRLPRALQ